MAKFSTQIAATAIDAPSEPDGEGATSALPADLTELSLRALRRFFRDESGVTAIEYGILSSLVGIVLISSVTMVGAELTRTFDTIAAGFPSSAQAASIPSSAEAASIPSSAENISNNDDDDDDDGDDDGGDDDGGDDDG